MSVGKRRLAAAQRTAAVRTTPSRAKRLGAWIIIVPALALFSFSVVAGAAGFNAKPDVASAAAKVVPKTRVEAPPAKSVKDDKAKDTKDDGALVVVDEQATGPLGGLLGSHGKEVCWISKSQLTRVSAVYRTSTSSLRVGHVTYTIVTVYGPNEGDLRQLLGSSAVQCHLVHVSKLYFLPFDPNIS